MSKEDLKRDAQPCKVKTKGADAWWYEEPDGVYVVTSVIDSDGSAKQCTVFISWAKIKNSLKRLKK